MFKTTSMTIQKICLSLTLVTLSSSIIWGQQNDTTIKNQTIQINRVYEPEVRQPLKPNLVPNLPTIDTVKLNYQYSVPQQSLNYSYRSIPIRPLALGKQMEPLPYENYAKLGIGTRSTLYLDAGIGSSRAEQYATTFHLRHLNQKGPIEQQKTSLTEFNAAGEYYFEKHTLGAELSLRNRGQHFYGYDHELYNYERQTVRNPLTDGALKIKLHNALPNAARINYQPEIGFSLFGDSREANESNFSFNLPAQWYFGPQIEDSIKTYAPHGQLSLALAGNFVRFARPIQPHSTQTSVQISQWLQLRPAFDIDIENVGIHIGLSPTIGDNSKFYLIPDLRLQAKLLSEKVRASLGWHSALHQNTYLGLSLQNPFLYNSLQLSQTRSHQAFAGIEATIGRRLGAGGTLSWRSWNDLPVFVNGYAYDADGKNFQLLNFAKLNAVNLELFADYQINELLDINLKGSWFGYHNMGSYDRAFGLPNWSMQAQVGVRPMDVFHLNAGFIWKEGIYALGANGNSIKLPTIFDLHLDGEYNLTKQWSLFIQVNNLLNNKYQEWYQYETYGLNLIGGVRFKF